MALELIQFAMDYQVPSTYSPVVLKELLIRAVSSTDAPLDPYRLFDRVGLIIDGGQLLYQNTVDLTGGAIVFRLPDAGLMVFPGETHVVKLMADIEPNAPYDHFRLALYEPDDITIQDVTDTTRRLAFEPAPTCASLPFESPLVKIYQPADRPTIRYETANPRLVYPGQDSVVLNVGILSSQNAEARGEVVLNGLEIGMDRMEGDGAQASDPAEVFTAVTLLVDGSPVAEDGSFADKKIRLYTDGDQVIGPGESCSVALACSLRRDAAVGTYCLVIRDSLGLALADKNLGGDLTATTPDDRYPVSIATVSAAAADLSTSLSNYPNPFTPDDGPTTIAYVLTEPARIDIEVFEITGQSVATIVRDAARASGPHQEDQWYGTNDAGLMVVSGTYFCRITARYESGRTETYLRKVAVLR
jgi:hypothetical protein